MDLLFDICQSYMKFFNFKKLIIKKLIIFTTEFSKILISLIRYTIKFSLRYILKNIVRLTPYNIRKILIHVVFHNPKIFFLAKKFRIWIIKIEDINDILKTDYFINFFIKKVIFTILKIILKNKNSRVSFFYEMQKNRFIRLELNKIIKEANLLQEKELDFFPFYKIENSEISSAEQEIYSYLKHNVTENLL